MNIKEIRQKYPQYEDMSDIQLADSLHAKHYSDMDKSDFYGRVGIDKKQIAQKNIEEERRALEVEDFGVKNIIRDYGEMIPLVGGYIDNIEAFAKAQSRGTDYKKELKKVRENQRRYGELVKEQGLGVARSIGKITGSIGASLAVPGLGKTKKAKVAFSALEGAIEGAGFADNQAKAGAMIGGILGGTIQTAFGFLPTRAVNEVAEATGDIRKIASDNKTMNLAIKGIDSSQRVANNFMEVAENALQRNVEDVSDELRKIVDLDRATNSAFGEYMESFGEKGLTSQNVKKLVDSKLPPFGQKSIDEALDAATEFTGSANKYNLVNLNEAKKVIDGKINANVVAGNTTPNRLLIKAKNKINDVMRESFPGFKEVQANRAQAFQLRDAYRQGFEFSPTVKKRTLKVFNELTGKEVPFNQWSSAQKAAFKDGLKEKKIITNLKTLVTKARNKAQARGSLNSILSRNLTRRGAAAPIIGGVIGGFPGVATGAAVGLGAEVGLRALDARTAKLLLSKQTPKLFRDAAVSSILARGAGKQLREE